MKKYILIIAVAVMALVTFFIVKSSVKKAKKESIPSAIMFGIDVSHYMGNINWTKVKSCKHPIEFVIVRATMGADRKDEKFEQNITGAKSVNYIVGAYHYYDPNEPSAKQAKNYLETIDLQKGDFIPIVDIERLSNCQSTERLKKGLKNWLNIVEKKYGVKPILYTQYSMYNDCLSKDFAEYPLWVAAYSNKKREVSIVKNAGIHQFAKAVSIDGIGWKVDGSDIKRDKLPQLLLK